MSFFTLTIGDLLWATQQLLKDVERKVLARSLVGTPQ